MHDDDDMLETKEEDESMKSSVGFKVIRQFIWCWVGSFDH